MKVLYLLVCLVNAVALSLLAALYGAGWIERDPQTPVEIAERVTHPTLFPQQNRAVEELLREIIARQEELERQESQLDERETEIRRKEIALARMRDELNATRYELDAYLDRIDDVERGNLRKLAEFYSKMDAQNAARLLADMESSRAARILALLGDRQAGAIMDAAVVLGEHGIERALAWSDTIRRMKTEKSTDEQR